MTTILALYEPETRTGWLAADGRATHGDSMLMTDEEQKIVIAGPWLLGTFGLGRGIDVLSLAAPTLAERADIQSLSLAIRDAIREDGWREASNGEGPPSFGASGFICVSAEGVWTICSQFSPTRITGAIGGGSGGKYAQGAARALLQAGRGAEESLRLAIQIAAGCDLYTGGPIQVARASPDGVSRGQNAKASPSPRW